MKSKTQVVVVLAAAVAILQASQGVRPTCFASGDRPGGGMLSAPVLKDGTGPVYPPPGGGA